MKRHKLSNHHSRRLFTRTARKTKGINYSNGWMRGGIRL